MKPRMFLAKIRVPVLSIKFATALPRIENTQDSISLPVSYR